MHGQRTQVQTFLVHGCAATGIALLHQHIHPPTIRRNVGEIQAPAQAQRLIQPILQM
jgi:hypothetical protein